MSATAQADPSAPDARAESGPASVVAAGRAHPAGGGPAAVHARPAELLVRRGLHARPRASSEPLRDAPLGLPHREQPAAVVPAGWADSRVLGDRRDRAAAALGAGGHRHRAGRLGDRPGAGRPRAAIVCAALVAVNPLFVWYSQEARAYGLFVAHLGARDALLPAGAARARPAAHGRFSRSPARLRCSRHYFAVFLLAPMALWLLARPLAARRAALPALAAIGVVGLALLPLISAQGGHGTQWIGRWPLSARLQAIPQYFLTGYIGRAARPRRSSCWSRCRSSPCVGVGRAARPRSRSTRRGRESSRGSGAGACDRARCWRGCAACCSRSCWPPPAPTIWRRATWSRR